MNEDVFDASIRSIERDEKLLALLSSQAQSLRSLEAGILQRDADIAELRDELLALSNRIEAVTRAVGGGLLHSVKETP